MEILKACFESLDEDGGKSIGVDELEDPLISKEHIYSFGWATEKEIKEKQRKEKKKTKRRKEKKRNKKKRKNMQRKKK